MAVSPWLSIVTVVKDDQPGFLATLHSIEPLLGSDIESVVIDGSTDRSLIRDLVPTSETGREFSWQEPAGIYPAMNAGLVRSSGDYVLFLNAGDTLGDQSLEAVRQACAGGRPPWLYGNARFHGVDGRIVLPQPFDYQRERKHGFARGRFPPHQATIASRSALQGLGGFDTSYSIAADYKVMLQLASRHDPVELPGVLAEFVVGGASTTHWRTSVGEFHRARIEVLQPRGAARLAELAWTGRQFMALGLHHGLSRMAR